MDILEICFYILVVMVGTIGTIFSGMVVIFIFGGKKLRKEMLDDLRENF